MKKYIYVIIILNSGELHKKFYEEQADSEEIISVFLNN